MRVGPGNKKARAGTRAKNERQGNHTMQSELEQQEITITAGALGLKAVCDGKEYYGTTFQDLLKILDNLIISAGGGQFEITTRFEPSIFTPMPQGVLRIQKVAGPISMDQGVSDLLGVPHGASNL